MASTATQFDTDCKLMQHMDDVGLTDSSTSATAITINGSVARSNTQSKFGGFSANFPGTSSDFLRAAMGANGAFGTADFTIDFWVYISSFSSNIDFIGQGPEANKWEMRRDGAGRISFEFGSSNIVAPSWTPSTGQWYHIAVTRGGTNLNLFIDGTSIASATDSSNFSSSDDVEIGYLGNAALNGFWEEGRVIKGTAVWTANFTPPVAAYTPVGGNTKTTRMMLMGIG